MGVGPRTTRVASLPGLLDVRPQADLQSPMVDEEMFNSCFVQRYRMHAGDHFGAHGHSHAQLSWVATGVGWVEVDGTRRTLTPTVATWLPPNVVHDIGATRAAQLYNLYLEPVRMPDVLRRTATVTMSPLGRQLLLHLAERSIDAAQRRRVEDLLLDLLLPDDGVGVDVATALPMPVDPWALVVAEALVADPAIGDTITAWGRRVGCSSRTLARRFVDETGLTFSDWRTQLRVRAAVQELAAGATPSAVAPRVGYHSTSAFVAAFRRVTGTTPGTYRRAATTDVPR